MTVQLTPTPHHTIRSCFTQASVVRKNGVKIWITGDNACHVNQVLRLLKSTVRRSSRRLMEIADMAQVIALRQTVETLEVLEDLEIRAAPNNKIRGDENELWVSFCQDIELTNSMLEDEETGIDTIAWIAEWQAGWCRYWALYHSDPNQRRLFAGSLQYNLDVQQPEIRRQRGMQ